MRFKLLEDTFSVCKIARAEQIPWDEPFVFVGKTDTEISLVCPTKAVPLQCAQEETGWRCFRVEGPLDFSLVGILSKITGMLAKEEIPVFAVSTFDTDYLLVREAYLPRARETLEQSGDTFV